MSMLVAYASKHGSTQGIAERIAEKLTAVGQKAVASPVKAVGDLAGIDAFVVGSAAYHGHWQKEAAEFVRGNRAVLADRPVWLFSSGPLGTEATDAKGRDLREAAEPKEIAEFREAIRPRDHRVFFGALIPPRSRSPSGRSGSCPPLARCSPKATFPTGPRSRRGPRASPTRCRNCTRADAEAPEGRSDGRARSQPTPVRSLGVLHAARGESDDRPVRWSHAHRPGSAERPPHQHTRPPVRIPGRSLLRLRRRCDRLGAEPAGRRTGRAATRPEPGDLPGSRGARRGARPGRGRVCERMGWRARSFFAALPDPADHPVLRIEPMGSPSRG